MIWAQQQRALLDKALKLGPRSHWHVLMGPSSQIDGNLPPAERPLGDLPGKLAEDVAAAAKTFGDWELPSFLWTAVVDDRLSAAIDISAVTLYSKMTRSLVLAVVC